MSAAREILEFLDRKGVEYSLYEHPPAFTVEEARKYCGHIPGTKCKNLFLRDHKGKQHFLLVMPDTRTIRLKEFSKSLQDRLSFASDRRLQKYLRVQAGSVSPLGLIFDTSATVQVYLDPGLLEADQLCFHPNDNGATLVFNREAFMKFLGLLPHDFRLLP